MANDPKYKRFKQQVDKALQSFENVNEWADFISFLSRLLKVRSRNWSLAKVMLTVPYSIDVAITFTAVSRDTQEAYCLQEVGTMLESGATFRGSSTCTRCLLLYIQHNWGECDLPLLQRLGC